MSEHLVEIATEILEEIPGAMIMIVCAYDKPKLYEEPAEEPELLEGEGGLDPDMDNWFEKAFWEAVLGGPDDMWNGGGGSITVGGGDGYPNPLGHSRI